MDWADLFERAEAHATDVETIRQRLEARRSADDDRSETADREEDGNHREAGDHA